MTGTPANCQGPMLDDITAYIDDPRYTIYVAMYSLIGFGECITNLEYTHFPPGTTKNEEFKLSFVYWEDLTWFVVGIPTEESGKMEALARECSLKLAKGFPIMLRHGVRIFPYQAARMFTLQYQPGHPAFRNDPHITQQLREAEEATRKRIVEKHHRAD